MRSTTTFMNDNQYFELESIAKDTEEPNLQYDTYLHDKRRKQCNIVKLIFLIIVGICYLIYASFKLSDANKTPLIRSYIDAVDWYYAPICSAVSYPTANGNSYFNISSIKMDGTNQEYIYFDLANDTDLFSLSDILPKIDIFCVIHFKHYWPMYHFYEDGYLIIPPNDTYRFRDQFNIEYIFWDEHYLEPNQILHQTLNYSIPSFLTGSTSYQIKHSITHPHELYDFIYETDSIDDIIEMQEWLGTDYYADLFSLNTVEIQLETTKYLDNTHLSSFNTKVRTSIAFEQYSFNCTDNADLRNLDYVDNSNNICASIVVDYQPILQPESGRKIPEQRLSRLYREQYVSYELPDLFSGLGGIVSGVAGIIASILGFMYVGFSWCCIHINGYAPYHSFDDEFKERLRRFIKSEQISITRKPDVLGQLN